jgi:penicillin G amidase
MLLQDLLRMGLGIALGKRLPIIDSGVEGTLKLAGLRAAVIIRRDENGIPYIEAQNDDDAFFALGFCQAQDRAFQVELLVRVARGTLSEIVGADGLPVDRLARRIGFSRIAEKQLAASDDATRAQFTSFARGINAALEHGAKKKCHEMTLLGAKHSTFEPHDPAAVLAFLAFALSSNWDAELARLRVLQEDGRDALLALEPSLAPFRNELFAAADALESADALIAGVSRMRETGAVGAASNAWAIAPKRTATGRPILASDPHLSPTLPAPWYLAHVRTPEWALTGACFVTQPVVSIGHNDHVAWGITAGHVDNTDLFVEHVGRDGRSVREGDRFVPCDVRRETIKVKGKPDDVVDVLVTPRGPIVGDVLGPARDAIAIKGTWMTTRTLRAYQAHRARNVDEARAVFDGYPGPSESRVFADVKGSIAWQVHGDIPVRKGGHGLVPAPGWNPAYGWKEERLPFAKHPRGKDPERGFVATANQCPPEVPEGAFCGVDWLDRHRYDRIVELLSARNDWTIDDVLSMHLDRHSLLTRELREVFVRAATDPIAKKWLEPWDGELAPTSVAASIFELAFADLARRIAQRHAPKAWRAALGEGINDVLAHGPNAIRRVGELTRLVRDLPPSEIADALAEAVRELSTKFGSRETDWQWGKVRPLRLRHAFAKQAPLDRLFALRDVAIGGDVTTIPQGSVDFQDPLGDPIGVPNMRAAIDVGAWENSRWSLLGGQSGNPCSPHFGDLLEHWDRGEGISIAWSKEDVERRARATLHLSS